MEVIEIRANKPYILIVYIDDDNNYLIGETYIREIKITKGTKDQADIILHTRLHKGKKRKIKKNT